MKQGTNARIIQQSMEEIRYKLIAQTREALHCVSKYKTNTNPQYTTETLYSELLGASGKQKSTQKYITVDWMAKPNWYNKK